MADDFILRNARIAGRGNDTFDIAIKSGSIAEIAPDIASDLRAEDAGGSLFGQFLIVVPVEWDRITWWLISGAVWRSARWI